MTAKEIIEVFSKRDPNEIFIVAWWERKGMFDWVSQEHWDELTEFVEDNMDWSHTHDKLSCMFLEYIKEESDG